MNNSLHLCPHLLTDCLARREPGSRRLQLALLQMDESQQTERSGTVEGSIQFLKAHKTLLGQVLGECLILLRHKEQTCLQEAHPCKALLITQFLVECEAPFQQCMGLLELPLFRSDACLFGRALALPPAVTQFLVEGGSLLQARMGQHKLTPDAGDRAQSIEAAGNTHGIAQILRDREAL